MSANVNVYELADEIENMVEEFLSEKEKQYRILKPKKEFIFSEEKMWDLINEILEYYGLTDKDSSVLETDPYELDDYKMFEFRLLSKQEKYIALIRIFFEKEHDKMLKLKKIEMFKFFNKKREKA